jgi:hypothetical protein
MATTFENVTVLHDTKPTFTFSNPRLLLQAAILPGIFDIRLCIRQFRQIRIYLETPFACNNT